MEVYLVRHTETVCEKGICYGQADVGLLEPYLHQFEQIKDQLPENAQFYSSPLQRCTLLADYLSSSNYETDERLMEMNFGAWELQPWDNIPKEELDPWMKDFVHEKVPSGESFTELFDRVVQFMESELKTGSLKPIVIVSHAGVIRSILCKISGLPLKDAFQNKVDFGSVMRIDL
ncbi:alpha-ribazole phosphatase [Flavobacterium sp. SM15]|uniref:alpha-ribazole phosphatase n=1 Tax=Flavobacterium sp. SM15 TaxID=2908005 RepID=UPI001EDA940E|nr:alpha-ribazole phosphatase [Flavobacterium sp. SM15]MCG2610471.1 alpha-ribazole phosphatase [Flavobacterium sp. SM15]